MSCTWLDTSRSIVENDIIDNLWRPPSTRDRWAKAYQLCRILFPSYSLLPSRVLAVGSVGGERDGLSRREGWGERGREKAGDRKRERERGEEEEEKREKGRSSGECRSCVSRKRTGRVVARRHV